VAFAVTLKSGVAHAPPEYMALAPLQLGASRIPLSAAQSPDFGTGNKSSRIPGLGIPGLQSLYVAYWPTSKTTGEWWLQFLPVALSLINYKNI